VALLEVDGLTVHFPVRKGLLRQVAGLIHAVDDVTFAVDAAEVVGLVGESGCGKSTLARTIVGLERPTAGKIRFAGQTVADQTRRQSLAYRRRVQMVFQDPVDSLNPRKSIFRTLRRPLAIHHIVPPSEYEREAARLLETVGLTPAARLLQRYPHQFSGGQRQRVGIARALAVRPDLLIADEPVSALDISIRAQILKLLKQLQAELSLAYLFITHDLGVVRSLAERVLVMYLGQIVEEAETDDLFDHPRHPYTIALQCSSPEPDPLRARRLDKAVLVGDLPSPTNPPHGCRFRTRCPIAQAICETDPPWLPISPGHFSRCHFASELDPGAVQAALRNQPVGVQTA